MSVVNVPSTPLYQLGAVGLRRQLSGASDWRQFEERVLQVHGAGRYTIALRPNLAGVVRAPRVPMYQLGAVHLRSHYLGQAGPQAVAAGGTLTAAALPSLVAAFPALMPLAAVPVVGAAIVVVAAVIAALWAAHDKRVAGAKAENQAINSAVATFDAALKAVFDAANSSDPTKNITAQQAMQLLPGILQTFFQKMAPFTSAPGAADASHGGVNCGTLPPGPNFCTGMIGGHACNSSCTATCCVGCQDLTPTIAAALQVFQNGGGTMTACTVYGSKYGANKRQGYQLTYTPPITASTAAGVASSVASAANTVSSAAVAAGLPSWAPLAGAALALFLLLKK